MSITFMPIQVVFFFAVVFAAASIVTLAAMTRWKIPGRRWRDGLYTNFPANFIKAENLDSYRILMRVYGMCFLAWVVVLLAWAVSKN